MIEETLRTIGPEGQGITIVRQVYAPRVGGRVRYALRRADGSLVDALIVSEGEAMRRAKRHLRRAA